MKRFEYFKTMKITELADVMLYGYDCKNCPEFRECGTSEEWNNGEEGCKKHVIDWLNEEVDNASSK